MGLIHMNGRVQDSLTGRFLSPDSHVPDPSFTQSYNRYSYVKNNPLSYIDPSGFSEAGVNVEGRNFSLSRAQALLAYNQQLGGLLCGDSMSAYCLSVQQEVAAFGGSIDDFNERSSWAEGLANTLNGMPTLGSKGGFMKVAAITPRISKQSDPMAGQSLSYRTIRGGPNDTSWTTRWELSKKSANGGIILQEITFESGGDTHHYFELWEVGKGSRYSTEVASGSRFADDSWENRDGLIRSGEQTVGVARFYEGQGIPSGFIMNNPKVPWAGRGMITVRASLDDPKLPLDQATDPVVRRWIYP
jgi:hypothetical protein